MPRLGQLVQVIKRKRQTAEGLLNPTTFLFGRPEATISPVSGEVAPLIRRQKLVRSGRSELLQLVDRGTRRIQLAAKVRVARG